MVTKKDLIIAVLATSCLTATLFTIIPTNSSVNPYDSWCDLNDDGIIDITDVVMVTSRYRTTGNPTKNVTVTNFPLDEEGNLRVGLINQTEPETITPARASICVILSKSASGVVQYDIVWTGTDSNSSSVTGIGNKTVRFLSGSVSGGGTQWAQQHGSVADNPKPLAMCESPASGWVEARDSNGTIIARISLPLTHPVQINNVDSFKVTVSVPYSIGVFLGKLARQAFAVAGVTYEVLG